MRHFTLLLLLLFPLAAQALDEDIHPYQSVRSAGMGGLLLTTGLYEENFFGNPARSNANPKVRIAILDPTFEINPQVPSTIGDIAGSGDKIQKISGTAGNNNHFRFEMTSPGVYIPPDGDWKWGLSAALITSVDANIDLRRNFAGDLQGIVDIGPAITVARKLLENDVLNVGATAHAIYRMAPKSDYSISEALQGSNVLSTQDAGNGAMIDFDLGATYVLPLEIEGFTFETAAVIQNLLGGQYSNLHFDPVKSGALPLAQPRAYGFGGATRRKELGPFTDFVGALEFMDIGNNPDGSLFKTVHLGAEARWKFLLGRVGINQGYFTLGMGVDLKFVTLDVATYGEEMSDNVGGLEDRRYALRIAFQI